MQQKRPGKREFLFCFTTCLLWTLFVEEANLSEAELNRDTQCGTLPSLSFYKNKY